MTTTTTLAPEMTFPFANYPGFGPDRPSGSTGGSIPTESAIVLSSGSLAAVIMGAILVVLVIVFAFYCHFSVRSLCAPFF
jgi:hypothetical protein